MPSENVKWKRESIIMKWTEVGFFHEDLGDWIYNDRYEIEMIQLFTLFTIISIIMEKKKMRRNTNGNSIIVRMFTYVDLEI